MSKWGRYDFCNLEPKKNWEKEFEDEIESQDHCSCFGIDLVNTDIEKIIVKYIGYETKVKIKYKNGCIQIERVK